jgi:hypothetical protein
MNLHWEFELKYHNNNETFHRSIEKFLIYKVLVSELLQSFWNVRLCLSEMHFDNNKNGQTKMGRNKLSFFQRHKYVKRNDLCYTRSSDSEYLF